MNMPVVPRGGTPPEPPTPPGPAGPEPGSGFSGTEGDWLQERLLEHRIVLLRGYLDHDRATRTAAQLLMLDASARHRIQLHLDSADGDLSAALLLTDTLDVLRVSVHVIVVGEVGGPSLAVLTGADRALAYRHARFRLCEPHLEIVGRASEVEVQAEHQAALLSDFVARLAESTGKPTDTIAADLQTRRYLTAEEAVEYGLVDDMVTAPVRH